MTTFTRFGNWIVAAAAALALGLPGVRGASLYMSVVAETYAPNAANFAPAQGQAVSYAAVDGGYIDAGDPVGGMQPASAPLVESAMAQALAQRGFQPAAPGSTPTLLIVYNWGDIRHDSFQIAPTDHLKGNDRARLLLVTRSADEKRIESDLVNDRYFELKVGALTRTERDREAIQLAHDETCFVVVSAYDVSALQQPNPKPVWQVRLSTRAIGHSMSEELVSLIHYGAPYFGQDQKERVDLKKAIVTPDTVQVRSPAPGLTPPANIDAARVREVVQREHAMWSGKFPND